MPTQGGEAVQVTTGGGHESFESPDGKLLYYQFRDAGIRSISTSETSPKAGEVFLPGVQQSFWAVGDKGIYFVEFEDKARTLGEVRTPTCLLNGAPCCRKYRGQSSSMTLRRTGQIRSVLLKGRSTAVTQPSP